MSSSITSVSPADDSAIAIGDHVAFEVLMPEGVSYLGISVRYGADYVGGPRSVLIFAGPAEDCETGFAQHSNVHGVAGGYSCDLLPDDASYGLAPTDGWPSATLAFRIVVVDATGTVFTGYLHYTTDFVADDDGGSGEADATPPTITLIAPVDGRVLRGTPIVVDVADETALSLSALLARFPGGAIDVVHDGFVFGEHYRGGVNAREVLDDGLRLRYTLLRDGGWQESPTIEFLVRDAGNPGVVVEVP